VRDGDVIDIPPEILLRNKDLVLCIDVMYVSGIGFLTSIDRSIKWQADVPIKNRTADELYRVVDVVLRKYNSKRGFNIVSINCDQEFCPIMERVADDLDVEMNYTMTDEHVPEAEHNNRTIKERVRAIYKSMPYSKIPRVMIRYLVL
jgi:hypothetical protein